MDVPHILVLASTALFCAVVATVTAQRVLKSVARTSLWVFLLRLATHSLPLCLVSKHAFHATTAIPAQLGAVSAAIIEAVAWTDADTSPTALRTNKQQKVGQAKAMLATAIRNGAKVKVEPGRGIWIAQFVQHLDNVDADDCVVMLYFHGGSFCFNTPETNAPWLLQFIKEFNAKEPHRRLVVFSVEYPLAPQHRFPAQLEASINAYRWLTTEVGIRTLFLCGDNAGGHLAISLLNTLNISDASSPEDLPDRVHPSCNSTPSTIPFASILFSPWVDPSMRYNAPHDGRVFDSISREGSRFAALNAFGNLDDDNETQPIAFSSRPGFAAAPLDDEYSRDLRHHRAQRDLYAIPIPDVRLALRGTLIVYGGAELLAPAVARFAHTLRTRMELEASSALLEVVSFEGMPHDFHLASFGSLKKPAVEARALAVSFLHKCLPSATSDLSP